MELNKENKYLSGVYKISNNIDNRIYIGSTQCFKRRFTEHLKSLADNTHNNPHLQKFVNKYGIDSIKFEILEIIDLEDLLIKEQYYLDNCIDFNRDFNICKIAGTPPNYNRSFSEKDILYIAELYNSGKSCCQISEILFNHRNQRSKIAKITKGESYSEYRDLFKYKKYNQTGRVISQETKNIIGNKNKGSRVLSISDIEFIKQNYNKLSGRKIAKLLNKSKSVIFYYIKNNINNGL